ncbi:hypothetical protein HX770_08060 [Vibrio parahaemolyticus]|nr:hypothetical protein [Vibrio parahaemolyticus]NWK18516.1 hypothetical protein [Vibrio parahaemolyticus]
MARDSKRLIQNHIFSKLNYYFTFNPEEIVQVGDYGPLTDWSFDKAGHLDLRTRNWLKTDNSVKSQGKKLGCNFSIDKKGIAKVDSVSDSGQLAFLLHGEGAYIAHYKDQKKIYLKHRRKMLAKLAAEIASGQIPWNDEDYLVTDVLVVKPLAYAWSDGKAASIEFTVKSSATLTDDEHTTLFDIGATYANNTSSSGLVSNVLLEQKCYPFVKYSEFVLIQLREGLNKIWKPFDFLRRSYISGKRLKQVMVTSYTPFKDCKYIDPDSSIGLEDEAGHLYILSLYDVKPDDIEERESLHAMYENDIRTQKLKEAIEQADYVLQQLNKPTSPSSIDTQPLDTKSIKGNH